MRNIEDKRYLDAFNRIGKNDTQNVFTPPRLIRRMLSRLHFTSNTKVLVWYNVEFLVYLVKEIGLSPENIYIYTNTQDKLILERQGYNVVYQKDIDFDNISNVLNNMKFDIIVGNPPYQDTSADRKKFNQLGNKKLWKMFLSKSSELVEYGGYISMLVPQAVTKSTNFGKPGDAISKMKGVQVLQIETNQEEFFNGVGIKICFITFKKTNEHQSAIVNGKYEDFNKVGFVTANPELQSIALKLLLNDGTVKVTRHTGKLYNQECLSNMDGIWSTRFGKANFSFDRDENQTKEIFWKSENNGSLINFLKSNLFCFVAWEGFVIVDKRWYHNFWSALSLKSEVTPTSSLDEIMDIYGLTQNEKNIIKSKDYTNVS